MSARGPGPGTYLTALTHQPPHPADRWRCRTGRRDGRGDNRALDRCRSGGRVLVPPDWARQPSEHGDRPLSGHTDTLTSVPYSPNGNTLATGGSDGTVRVWEL
ncbi:WD40 repeat domain-containing protein [Streptomyces fungicidicus]|uniref:WD40 repeat domain-containing protein n=1 Tax=Streptomyces fungicidicus TaxID=68203 RepID=UPI0036816D22